MRNKEEKGSLKLKKELFAIKAIQRATFDYRELADIQVYEVEDYVICEFKNCVYDYETTKKEFENYVIGLCNQKGYGKEDPVCHFYYKWICYIFTNSSLYVISRRKINDWEWK